ncbi:MAG: anthranilate phosphoribosyltransferase [Lentisphaerae bacterium GWF2_45_14]|nr:MAG: anthranilate phosphoribosyltransferase [Lentisphaerae bacterium GWF2_45_14]
MPLFSRIMDCLNNGRNISSDDAASAMREMIEGSFGEAQMAAFMTALKIKGETSEEIAGLAKEMREHCIKVKCDDPDAVDIVGTGGDGSSSINISTAASFIAAGAGVTIAKHGNRAVSSRSGSADVLTALGVKIDINVSQLEECLKRNGIAFLYAPLMHPALKSVMPVRKSLGFRTVFNILGPLCNPAGVSRYVMGVYSERLCGVIAGACADLGFSRALVVHGSDGLDEFTTTGPTYVSELKNGQINEYKVSPEDMGMSLCRSEDIKGGTPEENALALKDILCNKFPDSPRQNIAVLNAAAAIFASDKADCWEYAIEKALESVESGSALKKLKRLAEFTSSC